MTGDAKLNFSQRNGYVDLPSQLKLDELPKKTRYRIAARISQILTDSSSSGTFGTFINNPAKSMLKHIWIEVFENRPSNFSGSLNDWVEIIEARCENLSINELFDFLELLCKHPSFSKLTTFLPHLLEKHYSAYTFIAGQFIPIGNEQVAEAFKLAVYETINSGRNASKAHLQASAKHLRNGDWADSVRDSIHAVEALINKMDISQNTLGAALGEIEKKGHLHGALKQGFTALYGYTSDEDGIRHALTEGENPNVTQADAIYMLGSCASFVTYILSQNIPEKP